MANRKPSQVRRTLVQIDLAFWCLHEHPLRLAGLAVPTLVASGLLALVIATVERTWRLPGYWYYVLYAVIYPWLAALIVTFAPLPGAVFAWHRAGGEVLTGSECFQGLARKGPRLVKIGLSLALAYLFGVGLFGLPLLFFWPRTCLAPQVALFENDRRVFHRCRRLLREESIVYMLASLYFCLLLVLGGILLLPRLLLEVSPLGAKLIELSWLRAATAYLWVIELLGAGVLLSVMALCWSISLTLLYREIRRTREGEELREKLQELRHKFLGLAEDAPLETI